MAEAARRRLASRLAGELCELPSAVWASRSYGARVAEAARADDDLALATALADAWDLARDRPVGSEQVWSRTGPGGVVVVAHGTDWSLIARGGGPVLVVSDHSEQVARIDGDPTVSVELVGLIPELLAAARGEPPFDPASAAADLPPPPPMPWHQPGWNPRE